MSSTAIRENDFDAILVSELETLRERESRLRRLYPQLRKKAQLRELFLYELAEVQRRTQRLHAVLNPCEAFEPAAAVPSSPIMSPAAYTYR